MATSMHKVQIPFRVKGQTTCIHHKRGQLDLYCEKCQQLACINCLSTVHKSHPLCRLNEIIPKKKEDIRNYIDKTEKADLVHIDQYITATEEQLKDNASNFEKLSYKLKTLYRQIEEDNAKLLQTYKQDLEMYSTQLKKQVQECKIALQRGSDIQVYDTGCKIQSTGTIPVKPTLGTASFSPNRNPQDHLYQALGKVNISGQGHCQTLQGHARSVGSSAGQGLLSTQPQSKLKVKTPSTQQRSKGRKEVTSPIYTLLPQTKVLRECRSPGDITTVCPTTDDQVWTSYSMSDTLFLLDRNGKVIQEVKHNTLWVFDLKNNIKELVSGRLVHRFTTRETPLCICITDSNHVIVGMHEHISKYTTKGKLVLTSSATGTGKPLVCTPHMISECPVSHNVAVADLDKEHLGGDGKLYVVVMDTDFKVLFVYGGEVPHPYQPTSKSVDKQFKPEGMSYDGVGNLVIADSDNNSILLISGRGEFLRIIHTDEYWELEIIKIF